jgi:2-polyprenyl-6-methoxyphenol hydroxylase-like FAD-dependent oxidoreductase
VWDVGIIGAGTAGCAAATLLARAGHVVTLYERFPAPSPVGAGIVMQPTGLHVLERLGIAARIVDGGARIRRLHCSTASGRVLVDLPYSIVGEELFGVGLHRGLLFEALFGLVRKERIAVELGLEVAEIAPASGDQHTIVDTRGRRHGRHDLVIVADGARSKLRDEDASVRPYTWGALWFVGDAAALEHPDELRQVVDGTRRMIGVLPTGQGPHDDRRHATLYYSLRNDRVDEWRLLGLRAFVDEIARLYPAAARLAEQIEDPQQVLFAQYHDVVLRRLHRRGVVWLGDAAHAMSPQLGQGCNLALVDAAALADAIDGAPSLPEALEAFSTARAAHLGFYQRATRWLTPLFQSDTPLGLVRAVMMPLSARLPWVRRQMAESMCGLKLGVFSSLEPMPSSAGEASSPSGREDSK